MGKVIWFTGLSGSGKTTISKELKNRLEKVGKSTYIIDGDVIRSSGHKDLNFSREDIRKNNKLIAELAREKKEKIDFILVPVIAPYREDREMARSLIGPVFFELFVDASLEKCIERDVKGLYKKAISGEIKDLIGISKLNPYEEPLNPDMSVCSNNAGVNEVVDNII